MTTTLQDIEKLRVQKNQKIIMNLFFVENKFCNINICIVSINNIIVLKCEKFC